MTDIEKINRRIGLQAQLIYLIELKLDIDKTIKKRIDALEEEIKKYE